MPGNVLLKNRFALHPVGGDILVDPSAALPPQL